MGFAKMHWLIIVCSLKMILFLYVSVCVNSVQKLQVMALFIKTEFVFDRYDMVNIVLMPNMELMCYMKFVASANFQSLSLFGLLHPPNTQIKIYNQLLETTIHY